MNTLQNHVLPWTDRPLVNQNLVGGEDGIDDAGLSLSRILPAPKRRNDVSVVEHLHAYHDFSESTNQESLLKQYKEYQQLVARLNCELDRELTRHLTRIKGATASARAALRPSSRASAASRDKERRTR